MRAASDFLRQVEPFTRVPKVPELSMPLGLDIDPAGLNRKYTIDGQRHDSSG